MAICRFHWVATIAIALGSFCAPSWSQCQPDWSPGFGARGFSYALYLSDAVVFDDGKGGGPAIYACGNFQAVDNVVANYIARWNGERWIPVGKGTNGLVNTLEVFDDGNGSALFAGGLFTQAGGVEAVNIARWNGTKWSAIGAGSNDAIYALHAVMNRGVTELYAGGKFTQIGGIAANRIARWDGQQWFALDVGVGGPSESTAYVEEIFDVVDDNDGVAVYVGGRFAKCGSLTVNSIARWDGTAWHALGPGFDYGSSFVEAFAYFDDGNGPALFVGGQFDRAGNLQCNNIARWDGAAWSSVNGGVSHSSGSGGGWVGGIGILDDGTQKRLHVSGNFYSAGGMWVDNNAIWDGQAWSGGGKLISSLSMISVDAVPGLPSPTLVSAGYVFHDHELFLYGAGVAFWDGSEWQQLAGQAGNGLNGPVSTLAAYSELDGPRLYVGGRFSRVAGLDSPGLASWDGEQWHDPDFSMRARCMITARVGDATEDALYIAGADVVPFGGTNKLAKWNGTQWTELAGAPQPYAPYSAVQWDPDGAGPGNSVLVLGGNFDEAGETVANAIAVWDGTNWSTLDSGFDDSFAPVVRALAVFDRDGSGPRKSHLYAAGLFEKASGHNVNNIARWDGSEWRNVSGGLTGENALVRVLAVFDDGSGPALYAAGSFEDAGGVPVSNIAKWDGRDWFDVGMGVNGDVYSLYVFDDNSGSGPELFVGGSFTQAGDSAAKFLAKWNGSRWATVGLGVSSSVVAMTSFDEDGVGPGLPALYVGGSFGVAGKHASTYIARWGYPNRSSCIADVAGNLSCSDGIVNVHDLKFVIDRWGQRQSPAEINGDDEVGLADLEAVINAWGPCP